MYTLVSGVTHECYIKKQRFALIDKYIGINNYNFQLKTNYVYYIIDIVAIILLQLLSINTSLCK